MLLVLPFVALPLLYMAFTCNKADFPNLSSLHNFYRARLTRSYLGAANPERFRVRTRGHGARAADPLGPADAEALVDVANRRSVYEVDPADTVLMRDYHPQAHGGPVHILNVTVNQTHDPLGGLFNQDRKGQYLSITSAGHYRIGQEPWRHDSSFAESQLPAWMAISGAAVAPGLGGQTSSGLAMLLFMAGVRLGYWWEMAPPASGLQALLSPTKYRLLFGEALARFGGTEDRFWYLSDGGHFENTAAYALLRERTKLVVVADAGADPAYAFEDLENLVRKVRIDLQAEIEFVDVDSAGESSLAFFGSLDQLRDRRQQRVHGARARALRRRRPQLAGVRQAQHLRRPADRPDQLQARQPDLPAGARPPTSSSASRSGKATSASAASWACSWSGACWTAWRARTTG
jgi:hypothetical protein